MGKTTGGVRSGSGGGKALMAVKSGERGIRMRKREVGILYNKYGQEVFRQQGGKSEVAFSREQQKLMKDRILTHNHPGTFGSKGVMRMGTSLSGQDLVMAVSTNLKEIRAITPHGYTYSMKRPKGGWKATPREVADAYNRIDRQVHNKLSDYLYSSGWNDHNVARANIMHNNIVNREMAKLFGWKYSRSK